MLWAREKEKKTESKSRFYELTIYLNKKFPFFFMRSINFLTDTFIFISFDVEMEGEGGKYLIFICLWMGLFWFFFVFILKISMSSLMINGNRFLLRQIVALVTCYELKYKNKIKGVAGNKLTLVDAHYNLLSWWKSEKGSVVETHQIYIRDFSHFVLNYFFIS